MKIDFVEFDDFEKVFGNYSKGTVPNEKFRSFINNAPKLDIARTFKESFIRSTGNNVGYNIELDSPDGFLVVTNDLYNDVNNL